MMVSYRHIHVYRLKLTLEKSSRSQDWNWTAVTRELRARGSDGQSVHTGCVSCGTLQVRFPTSTRYFLSVTFDDSLIDYGKGPLSTPSKSVSERPPRSHLFTDQLTLRLPSGQVVYADGMVCFKFRVQFLRAQQPPNPQIKTYTANQKKVVEEGVIYQLDATPPPPAAQKLN